MREIIFRGKRMDNGEWVYGSLFVGFKKCYICPEAIAMYNFDGALCLGGFIEVDPSTVGQYTGLKDKNGKRIFEGDILGSRYDKLYPDDVAIEVVKWFRNGWYIQQENNLPDALCEYGVLYYSEVIGNIHDNPELLNEEAKT